MPLILKKDTEGATLLLWSITESETELRKLVTEGDRASADRFTSPSRRLEHLAWRAALRCVIPDAEVSYGETGAPSLGGSPLHLGVAHTRGCAAVMLSAALCAVDIERSDRNFANTLTRFVSPAESSLQDAARPDFPAAVWCAKEAMYKFAGRRELDFLRDLALTSSDLAHGTMRGTICGQPVDLHSINSDGYLIIYIAQ